MSKYKLEKSGKPNRWVLTDEENLITIIFEEGKFNETQKVQMLNTPNLKNTDMGALASKLAKTMREIGEWLKENYPALYESEEITPTDEIKRIQEIFGMKAKVAAKAVGLTANSFRYYLTSNKFKEKNVEKLIRFIKDEAEKLSENN